MTRSWVTLSEGIDRPSQVPVPSLRARLRRLELEVKGGSLESKAKARAEIEALNLEIAGREQDGLTVTIREFAEPPVVRRSTRPPVSVQTLAGIGGVHSSEADVPALPWRCLCEWNNTEGRMRCMNCGTPRPVEKS